MTHPLIPQILQLATPICQELRLELVGAVFQTSKKPPVLRVEVRNPEADTSLEDCERLSRALEQQLDVTGLLETAYILEISSPGLSPELTTAQDFIAFKGFTVFVQTDPPYSGKTEWKGRLQGRDEEAVYLNQKGKTVAIPRTEIVKVQLAPPN